MRALALALVLLAPVASAEETHSCEVDIDVACVVGSWSSSSGEGDCDGAYERHAYTGTMLLPFAYAGFYEGCWGSGAERQDILVVLANAQVARAQLVAGEWSRTSEEGSLDEEGASLEASTRRFTLLAVSATQGQATHDDDAWEERDLDVTAAHVVHAGAWWRGGGPHGAGCVAYARVADVGAAPGCNWLGPLAPLLFP